MLRKLRIMINKYAPSCLRRFLRLSDYQIIYPQN